MTRKKYIKMVITMTDRIVFNQTGKHPDGKTLRWYHTRSLKNIKAKSYAEAWEMLKPARELAEM